MTPPLRYGINVSLDGCVHHEAGLRPDAESMAFWTDELRRSDTLLYGSVTYELMQGAWRRPASGPWPDWMDDSEIAVAEVMDPMRKVVASTTLDAVDWNAELLRGEIVDGVRRLKEQPGRGISLGGVRLPVGARRGGAHRRVHVRRASGDRRSRAAAARRRGADARARRAAGVPVARHGAAVPAGGIARAPRGVVARGPGIPFR